jgi:HAD superfamily hydrolase (TIGR01484 family)
MRFLALATDYDGTLSVGSIVADDAWEAVRRLRDSGRKLLLVTGRALDDLRTICPHLERFDRVVAENGGVLYRPDTGERRLLAPPPPREFVEALRDRGVARIGVGSTLVATVTPYETVALQVIRDLGLELQVVFNKGAVMIVPPGMNKATGLAAALEELGLSPHNVVGVGDAENDHAFLDLCECSAAVSNALPMLKKHADIVTAGDHHRGVIELIDELVDDDLRHRERRLARHHILLGRRLDPPPGKEVRISPYGTVALVAGPSGGGKSTATTGLLERLAGAGYQFCALDPEGDYEGFEEAVVLGDAQHAPSHDEVLQLLRQPRENAIVNLLRVPLAERPLYCAGLLPRLQALRVQTGRPHWLVFDEAHHLFPADWDAAEVALPQQLETALLITVHPGRVSPAILRQVDVVLAVGAAPGETLKEFARSLGKAPPRKVPSAPAEGEALVWRPGRHRTRPSVVAVEPGRTERRRHIRKYAEGLLIPERSFYFRGPEGKLNLRAHNLVLFLELAEGVDDDTWLHHLRRGDYSRWFGGVIGDEGLAGEAREIEARPDLSAAESRERIREAIERRYTQPENPTLPRIGPSACGRARATTGTGGRTDDRPAVS